MSPHQPHLPDGSWAINGPLTITGDSPITPTTWPTSLSVTVQPDENGWFEAALPTAPPSITEFLEARIAEDEAEAEAMAKVEFFNGGWSDEHAEKVLAECAAKRAIIAEHASTEVASLDRETWGKPFEICRTCAVGPRQVVAPCPTLRILAAVYKDHPDYQQEWGDQ